MAPELTNKQLKELKKQEKAAKRAAAKGGEQINENSHLKTPIIIQKTTSQLKKQLNNAKIPIKSIKKPPMFGHLENNDQRVAGTTKIASIVHPSILSLTLKISTYKIVGSIERCKSMMEAFKDVIKHYETPDGNSLQRHLTTHLSYHIEYLKTGRPLSLSMGNAIRWLKQRISIIPITTSDEEAKIHLIDEIDNFIMEKILIADKVIVQYANKHITNGSKIITFGHSNVLYQLFEYCSIEQGKNFEIFIIDSKPLFEGKKMAKKISKLNNIKCHYNIVNSLSNVLATSNIDFCFLGAHSMLSNGRLYSRVGTALVAMACKNKTIPVLVCCESLKFSDKVQLDSVTQNELGDPNDLINTNPTIGFNLQKYLEGLKINNNNKSTTNNNNNNKKQQQQQQQQITTKLADDDLSNWNDFSTLNILNILYDLTPPEYIQKIITEFGALPSSSVPVVLREYKNTN